jgi:cation/acetate symporter
MRSVSWTQIAQGALILAGFLVPAAWLTWQTAGMPVPQLALGEFLGMASNAEAALGVETGHAAPFTLSGPADPVGSEWDFLALAATVMLGTAAMPVLLQRSLTTPTVSGARSSAGWALLFIVLLLITVPTYALFARAELFTLFAEAGGTLAYEALPAWLLGWPEGVLTICGQSAVDAAAVQGACGAERAAGVTLADIGFAPEFLVLAAPEMAGLSSLATVLILLGGLAAVLSSVSGQLLAISSSVAHDVGFRIVDREMSAGARVALGRIMALAVAALAGFAALDRGTGIAEVVGWTLSLAAGGLFAPIVLGIWDRRTTGPGAAAGIVAGYGLALLYIAAASVGPDGVVQSGDEVTWLGLPAGAAGLIGAAGSLVVTWLVSRVTPAPGPDTEDFIEEMRVPRDHAIAPIN